MLRVAILGWYGWENAGDDRMGQALMEALSGHDVHFFGRGTDIQDTNTFDWWLIGGGDLWHEGFCKGIEHKLRHHKTRLGAVGLGVPELNSRMANATDLLLRKASFVYVRDETSWDLLGRHHKVFVGPDLTWYKPLEAHGSPDSDILGINLRPWPVGRWVGPSWNPRAWIDHALGLAGTLRPLVLCSGIEGCDVSLLSQYMKEVPTKFSPSMYDNLWVTLAMRFHGILFSAQAGIPFVGIAYHRKCVEIGSTFGMGEFILNLDDHYLLSNRIALIRACYCELKDRLFVVGQHEKREARQLIEELVKRMQAG